MTGRAFRLLRTLHYPWEGWGLTQDGKHLILSDGSETLHFLNPETMAEVKSVRVTYLGEQVKELNELEYIHGEIYANVWMTDKIARISPETGKVVGWIDLSGILPEIEIRSSDAVLNGIAYDAAHNRVFVTGKLWPRVFEIQVVPKGGKSSQACGRNKEAQARPALLCGAGLICLEPQHLNGVGRNGVGELSGDSIEAGFDGDDVLWVVDGVGCGERFCAQGDYISDFGYAFCAVEHDGYGLRVGAGVDEFYVEGVVL